MRNLKLVKGKKPKLNAAQRREKARQRQHIREIRAVFRGAGFVHVSEMTDKILNFDESQTDFDDLFVSENVIVLTEYTTSGEAHVRDHLLKKNFVFSKISTKQEDFARYLKDNLRT